MHRSDPVRVVLDDPLAWPLAGDQAAGILQRLESDLSAAELTSFSRWVCVRARWPEDLVDEKLQGGLNQYVILGAGLDSFAYRRPDLAGRLKVFEVDHPASQAWKRERLEAIGVVPPPNLVYVATDFEAETLHDSLERAGLDFNAPTVFSWIGVTTYLSLDAIRATLASVATCSAPVIVLTYNLPPSALEGLGRRVEASLATIIGEMGEPFVSLFTPAEIEHLLHESGFGHVVHFGPEDAIRTYFPGRSDVTFGGAQRLAMATRT